MSAAEPGAEVSGDGALERRGHTARPAPCAPVRAAREQRCERQARQGTHPGVGSTVAGVPIRDTVPPMYARSIRMVLTVAVSAGTLATTQLARADHERPHERQHEREKEHHEGHREERHDERRDDRHDEHREAGREHRGPRVAPPRAREERHEAFRKGYAWIGGRHEWRGDHYEWIGGGWQAERRGRRWRDARWDQRDGEYVYLDGGWDIIAPSAAPPQLREERWETRGGYVWLRGRWDWRDGEWAWSPGHYERERVGHRWRDARWEQRDGVYISVDGGWE